MSTAFIVLLMVALYVFVGIGFAKITGNCVERCRKNYRLFLMVCVGTAWMPLALVGMFVLFVLIVKQH